MPNQEALDQQCINTISFLSVDAMQEAQSGHLGAPMGAAAPPVAGASRSTPGFETLAAAAKTCQMYQGKSGPLG
jgi:hypothetical protein